MSKVNERRLAKLEASKRAPMTAIGVAPAHWSDEEASLAIMQLANAEGHTGPLELVTLRDPLLDDPVLLDVCDFPALLNFVASKGRRITDPVETKYEH